MPRRSHCRRRPESPVHPACGRGQQPRWTWRQYPARPVHSATRRSRWRCFLQVAERRTPSASPIHPDALFDRLRQTPQMSGARGTLKRTYLRYRCGAFDNVLLFIACRKIHDSPVGRVGTLPVAALFFMLYMVLHSFAPVLGLGLQLYFSKSGMENERNGIVCSPF